MTLGNTLNILRPPERATMPVQTGWNEDLVKNMHDVLGRMQQQISAVGTVSTSSPTSYATKAVLEAATVLAVVTTLLLTSHTTDGDDGGALYKRVGSEPSHNLKVQSLDNAWWELVPDSGVVRVKQAGGVEGADITTALQDCINFAIYGGAGLTPAASVVLIDVREGTLSETIHVSYGRKSGTTHFAVLTVRGLGMAYSDTGSINDTGTLLTSTVTDRPGFALTGGRNILLEDFELFGPVRSGFLSMDRTGTFPTVESNWDAVLTTAGVTPGRRYAPHAAIVIDAYTGTAPGTDYPDVTFPSWVDASPVQYGKNFSSHTTMRRIQIEGWEVGIMNCPADATGNGDFTQSEQVAIKYCKIGTSDGQTQSRSMRMLSPIYAAIFTCLTSNTHGKQLGNFGGEIINMSCGSYIGRIFSFRDLTGSPILTFRGLYAEGLHRIGDFSSSAGTEGQLLFDNAEIKFRHNLEGVSPTHVLEGGTGEVVFRGGQFSGYSDCIKFNVPFLVVDGTVALPVASTTKKYMQIFHNATQGGIVVDDVLAQQFSISARHNPYNLATGSLRGSGPGGGWQYSFSGRDGLLPLWSPPCNRGDNASDTFYGHVQNPRISEVDSKAASWTSVSRTDREIAFTTSAETVEQVFNTKGYMPGDFIIDNDTGSVMVIRSIVIGTGATEAELVTNYVDDGGGSFSLFEALSLTTGSVTMKNARVYAAPRKITGTIGTGVATISAIAKLRIIPSDYGLAVNDWLMYRGMNESTFQSSNNAKITAIDTSSDLITMNGNAAQDLTLDFDIWVRAAPTNEAAR